MAFTVQNQKIQITIKPGAPGGITVEDDGSTVSSLIRTLNAAAGLTVTDQGGKVDIGVDFEEGDQNFLDFLFRGDDDSLLTLNDGQSPPLQARHEGQGAWTFGHRDSDIGPGSILIGGTASNPAYAAGDGGIAIGTGATAGGFFDADRSIAIGKDATAGQDSIEVGAQNSSGFGIEFSVLVGNSNTIDNDEQFIVYGIENTLQSNATPFSQAFGRGLKWGDVQDGFQEPTTLLGTYNEEHSGQRIPFVLGCGAEDTDRKNAMWIEVQGTSRKSILHASTIALTNTPSEAPTFGHEPSGGVVSQNVSFSSNGLYPSKAVILGEVDYPNNDIAPLSDSLLITTPISNTTGITFRRNVSVESSIDGIGKTVQNSILLATDINAGNLSDFEVQDGFGVIEGLFVNGDTLAAYHNKSGISPTPNKAGSVIIAGGQINDVQNAVAIAGATATTANSVVIGNGSTSVEINGNSTFSGTFTNGDGATVTVNNGLITDVS